MAGEDFLHLAGGEAVAGDIDDVIGAAHHPDIAILIHHSGIGGVVIAGVVVQIGLAEACGRLPQRVEAAGRHGEFDGQGAHNAGGEFVAGFVHCHDIKARAGLAAAAQPGGEEAQAAKGAGDGPAGFGLPPMVDHRAGEQGFCPLRRIGVAALAGEEEGFEFGEVVLRQQRAFGVLFLDGADGGGGGEEQLDLVLGADPPEGAGIGRADRLALIEQRGAAGEERRIDNVAMAHHPADIAGRPHDIAGREPVDHRDALMQRHGMAAVFADNALGLSRRAAGVEDIEWVGGLDRDARVWGGCGQGGFEIDIVLAHRGLFLRALQQQGEGGFVGGHVQGGVEQGFVMHHPRALDAATGGDDGHGLGVINARGQFGRGEAAEDHRMHRTEAGAGQHGHHRLGQHGHVDDDALALGHAARGQGAGEFFHACQHLGIGVARLGGGDGAVIDQRGVGPAPGQDMPVERIVAGVQPAIGEP